ncbi:MAG: membrane protein insertion efficiency factor YidD [Gammaproteobacteria bacterium]|nr:membrane protein insertion efficiency factor YidD [Gammaproteobacteria bacterium]
MKVFLLKLIWLYQATLSGFLGQRCRFYPSCSEYASESITRFGVLSGSGLAIKRVCRCHPFDRGGVDLVPDLASEERE